MAKRKSISVWIVLKDGKNKGKIALQRRSPRDISFHYIYQATWSGKGEVGESVMDAVKRECKEELGQNFYENFNFLKLKLVLKEKFIWENTDEIWDRYNYTYEINETRLNTAKLHDGAFDKFTFVEKETLFYPINSKKNPKNNIVLFNDQYKILNKLLNAA